MGVLIGVAIGQRREPSGLAVVEDELRKEGNRKNVFHYLARHLERLPPGTSYPAIARRTGEVVAELRDRGKSWPYVFVDATGLGDPVVELVKDEVRKCRVRSVYFTHGDQRSEDGDVIRLGKGYAVARLQTLLQSGQLHLPRTPEAEALAKELLEYEIEIAPDANDRYGAFKVGTHDDLVTALGLAVHKPRTLSIYPTESGYKVWNP